MTCATATLLAACAAPARDVATADPLPLIPAPARAERAAGWFTVDAGVPLVAGTDPQLSRIADYFAELVARTTNVELQREDATATAPARSISFELVQTFAPAPEG
jgi:uncharacterized protein (DUF1684 family)